MQAKQLLTKALPWLYWIVAGGFVVITRWIHKSDYLFHHDSVQFALALIEFDVVKHQPHPPGYIVYIWLGKLVNLFISDPNLVFVVLGIMASLVGLVAITYLARAMFGQLAGYLAGVFYITNASVWFHGLVAEVYIVEAILALVVVTFIYRYWRDREVTDLVWMTVLLGLLGGVRQSTEIFILPLAIYVLVANRRTLIYHWKLFTGLIIAANLAWLVPVVYLSGGLSAYWQSLSLLTRATVWSAYARHGINLLIQNGALLWKTIKQTLSVNLLILFLAGLPFIAQESRRRYPMNPDSVKFWLWAFVPGLLLLQLTLMRNPGYGLYFVVLVLALTAGAVVLIAKVVNRWRHRWGTVTAVVLALAVVGVQVFGFYRTPALNLDYISASIKSVELAERQLDGSLSSLPSAFRPEDTIIFVNGDLLFFGVRHLQYYLPQFDVYSHRPAALTYDEESLIWHVQGPSVSDFREYIEISDEIKHVVFWGAREKMSLDAPMTKLYSLMGLWIGYIDLSDPAAREFVERDKRFKLIESTE